MRVYCDSVILIYHLEGAPSFQARANARLAALWSAGDTLATSDLVRFECRMLPIRLGDAAALALYDNLLNQPNVMLIPLTTAVFDRGTQIRASHNFTALDSLHLATAIEGCCDRFLTNDARLSSFTGIPVEVLP
jgi:predicted nucleic acid-binding protein